MTRSFLFTLHFLLGLSLLAYLSYALLTVRGALLWKRSRPDLDHDFTPGVTILKPVCGADPEAESAFSSFFNLDYPNDKLQILFGALEPDDEALELARRLKAIHPDQNIDIVLASEESAKRGLNRKVCSLLAMLPHAQHELLILCDSDMRVTPDYVRRVTAPFHPYRQKGAPVGLVTCPYKGEAARSIPSALEALGIGADFMPSVLVSRMLEGMSFALGATISLTQSVLQEIGGFESLLQELADDYLLGKRVCDAGYTVVLSDYIVEDMLGEESFQDMWSRRVRWARTVRFCRPGGYAGVFITHGFALSLLYAIVSGINIPGITIIAAALALRFLTVFYTSSLVGDAAPRKFWILLPLSDLLSSVIYLFGWCGSEVTWRGQRFRLAKGGRLLI